MKTVSISELKTHLSKYLRMVGRGEKIVVMDRKEPVAQLGPLEDEATSPIERLIREGKLRRGTQDWSKLKFSKLKKKIDIQASLQAVRDEGW